jgi:oligoendopeptidase F
MKKNWNLADILNVDEYETILSEFELKLEKFHADYMGSLVPDISEAKFKEFVIQVEHLLEGLNRLYAYPMLAESVDQSDNKIQFLKSKSINLISLYDDKIRAFSHWIKGKEVKGLARLDDVNAQRLFNVLDGLKYEYTRSRDLAKRTLSEKEEEIITKKSLNGIDPLQNLRAMIETDQKYVYTDPITENDITIDTTAELMKQVYSDNALVRENTYNALFKPFSDNHQKYFLIYQAIIKDWNSEMVWRNYDSAIAMRNESNDIPDKAVEQLIESCVNNQKTFNKFFEIKAKYLGLNKLKRYDLYAQIKSDEEQEMDFTRATEMVLGLFKDFDEDFYKHAKSILDEMHVDSHPNKKKRSGAFCATISPSIRPYVMLNFSGKKRDSLVLAHELGHAVHSCFAAVQNVSTQEAPLTLAETASTFAEMIVFENLYKNETSIKKKREMLIDKIADSYATISRQINFVVFENKVHKLVPNGIQLEDFNKLYLDQLREHFGDSVEVGDIFQYEWAYIPHIVNSPFYCYSYAFGELLSFSLYKKYKETGKPFIKTIKEILTAGGSENPTLLLEKYGIDIMDKEFWNEGFSIIEEWVKELENLS